MARPESPEGSFPAARRATAGRRPTPAPEACRSRSRPHTLRFSHAIRSPAAGRSPQPPITRADGFPVIGDSSLQPSGCSGVDRVAVPALESKEIVVPLDKPNILVIWGDDIGISNLSCYSDGLMGYRTPNIDRIAEEGARFTDFYGEQSCTAGRAAFICGQNPIRTGLTKVGMPGAAIGLQPED